VSGGAKDWQAKKRCLEGIEAVARDRPAQCCGAEAVPADDNDADAAAAGSCDIGALPALCALALCGWETSQHTVAAAAAAATVALLRACNPAVNGSAAAAAAAAGSRAQPLRSAFPRRAAAETVAASAPWLKEKAKRQLQGDLTSMYVDLAAAVGPNLVAAALMEAAAGAPAPGSAPGPEGAKKLVAPPAAVLERIAETIGTLAAAFGVGRLSVPHVLGHLLGPAAGAQSTAAGVRGAAKAALAQLYAQVGPPLERMMLKPMAPAAVSVSAARGGPAALGAGLDAKAAEALAKELAAACNGGAGYSAEAARALLDGTQPVLGEARPPRVALFGEAPAPAAAGGAGASSDGGASARGSGGDEDAAVPLFERVDLFPAVLPRAMLAELDTPNDPPPASSAAAAGGAASSSGGGADADSGAVKPWQVRLAAIEASTAALRKAAETGAGVLVNESVTALVKALARRLADSNANLKPKACAALGALAAAAGPGIHVAFRHIGER